MLEVVEVGPRDGLQNESVTLLPAVRAELIERLIGAGLRNIETTSFVNARLVPAMADPEEVLTLLSRRPGVTRGALILNERGYDRALAAGVDAVNYSFPATDAFARRNQNTTVADATALAQRLVHRAAGDQVPITITLSVAFGCPFEGPVAPATVLGIVERLQESPGVDVVLADTIGAGVPRQVRELVAGALALGVARVGAHFHNTRNTGIANAFAALEAGAVTLDASVGGAGGCPFAPRATGNIATEDLVYLLEGEGIRTGINLEALIATSHWLGRQLGRELPGMVSRAGPFPE